MSGDDRERDVAANENGVGLLALDRQSQFVDE